MTPCQKPVKHNQKIVKIATETIFGTRNTNMKFILSSDDVFIYYSCSADTLSKNGLQVSHVCRNMVALVVVGKTSIRLTTTRRNLWGQTCSCVHFNSKKSNTMKTQCYIYNGLLLTHFHRSMATHFNCVAFSLKKKTVICFCRNLVSYSKREFSFNQDHFKWKHALPSTNQIHEGFWQGVINVSLNYA